VENSRFRNGAFELCCTDYTEVGVIKCRAICEVQEDLGTWLLRIKRPDGVVVMETTESQVDLGSQGILEIILILGRFSARRFSRKQAIAIIFRASSADRVCALAVRVSARPRRACLLPLGAGSQQGLWPLLRLWR
jgi:hypothetical protein